MPIYEVTRTVLEQRVIRAADEAEATRLISEYGANEVEATCTEITAERLPDDTPLPEEAAGNKKSLIIAGDPIDGISVIGPFDHPDDALEHAENNQGLRDSTWWVTPLHEPQ